MRLRRFGRMLSEIEELVLLKELVFNGDLNEGIKQQLVSADEMKGVEEQLVSTDTDADDSQIIIAEKQKSEKGKDKIPVTEDDQLPNLGEVGVTGCFKGLRARTLQELEDLYREHANKLGFTYKKTTQRRNHQQVIIEKYFACSCEGKSRQRPTPKKRRGKVSQVTGCKAIMRIKLVNNLYTVVHHQQHNHEFTRPAWGSKKKIAVDNGKSTGTGKSNPRDNEATASNLINANGNGESNARDNEATAANCISANGNGENNARDNEATAANSGNGKSIGKGNGNMIVVKATCGDDTAKFPLCSNSGIAELRKELDDIFGLGSNIVKLKYKDDDGSWITLFRDKDFHFHIDTLKASGQPVILELSVHPVAL